MGNFPKLPEGTKLPVGKHQVTVLKYLSEGGFAHIYKCHIDPPEQNSEIACLKRVIVPDKAGLDLLRKEVDVMKTLSKCRNIVRYYDSHAERLADGTYQVLVLMELCPNKSLLDYMNSKIKTKLSETEILKIILDISIGIYEMHSLKMIHRDIKIENVLIDELQNFKLCDFGSTSSPIMPPTNPQEFQRISHDILYQTTPQYRSPEMIDLYRGFPINEKSDIWAFGCFLYKLCFYTTPFEANGDIAILHASFQFPSQPMYSGDLLNLIIIMLQESPNLRPNIIQVIMLISKMMSIDYKDLRINDIYKLGAYNFNALHAYQQQQQIQQKKQQQSANVSRSTSTSRINQSIPLQSQPQQSTAQSDAFFAIPANQPVQSRNLTGKSTANSARSSLDLNEHYDKGLDNAEERYPSLENLVIEQKPQPTQSSQPPQASQKLLLLQYQGLNSQPMVEIHQPAPFTLQPPPVLSPTELQKLSPEQLLAYDYQHQAYQYEFSKYQYQQQQYQRQYQQQYQYQQQQRQQQQQQAVFPQQVVQQLQQQQQQQQPQLLVQSKTQELQHLRSHSKSRKSSEPSDLEKKEAWEKQYEASYIPQDTEKLVSDIFGTSAEEGLSRAHTRQSSKSERSHSHSKSREDLSKFKSREEEFTVVPTVSVEEEESNFENISLLDEKDLIEFESQFPETLNDKHIISSMEENPEDSKPSPIQISKIEVPAVEGIPKADLAPLSNSLPKVNGINNNPFPIENIRENGPVLKKFASTSPVIEKYSGINVDKLSANLLEAKSANPWGKYRVKSQNTDSQTALSSSSKSGAVAPPVPAEVALPIATSIAANSLPPSSIEVDLLNSTPVVSTIHATTSQVNVNATNTNNTVNATNTNNTGITSNNNNSINNLNNNINNNNKNNNIGYNGQPNNLPSQLSMPISIPMPMPLSNASANTNTNAHSLTKAADDYKKYQVPNQINLIDLEVGLESSSASSTPALMPKSIYLTEQGDSLLDLSIEKDKPSKPADQRKKRISSGINIPNTINFQEEIIDWSSDDENPEKNSKLNRLSIRNSLRSSRQPKRSEYRSSSLDVKKSESESSGNSANSSNNIAASLPVNSKKDSDDSNTGSATTASTSNAKKRLSLFHST